MIPKILLFAFYFSYSIYLSQVALFTLIISTTTNLLSSRPQYSNKCLLNLTSWKPCHHPRLIISKTILIFFYSKTGPLSVFPGLVNITAFSLSVYPHLFSLHIQSPDLRIISFLLPKPLYHNLPSSLQQSCEWPCFIYSYFTKFYFPLLSK